MQCTPAGESLTTQISKKKEETAAAQVDTEFGGADNNIPVKPPFVIDGKIDDIDMQQKLGSADGQMSEKATQHDYSDSDDEPVANDLPLPDNNAKYGGNPT